MRTDWRSAYNAAIGETDPANVQRLIERARHAIIDRLIDLAPQPQDAAVNAEREELEEASRKLTQHDRARLSHR